MNEAEALIANDVAFETLRAFNRAMDSAFGFSASRDDVAEARAELATVPVRCRFYGISGRWQRGLELALETQGNQCGLILESHSPCRMEIAGEAPDEQTCPLVKRIFSTTEDTER